MHDLCDLRKLMIDLRRFEEALREKASLSLNEALCLCQVHEGKRDPGTLSVELELSPSRLSRILESLEKRKLITRTTSDNDRRTVVVCLTDSGEALVAKLHGTSIPIPEHLIHAIESMRAESTQSGA
ncbi:MAG: MarR family transcriptional regulator [Sphaerochaetaceae bacterium]|jgi:DNA-binding MarR family transcriptional regulator|nr:MarR family transcriptional regulator [Sphaerochaetaceae bacterium]MDD3941286.1 MarR family transcriptional regulator [Sphaerochaetaceae bacterium]MDX9939915.1 MarR family transcriptional regulator [Sphaerochaetaceae bacterium]